MPPLKPAIIALITLLAAAACAPVATGAAQQKQLALIVSLASPIASDLRSADEVGVALTRARDVLAEAQHRYRQMVEIRRFGGWRHPSVDLGSNTIDELLAQRHETLLVQSQLQESRDRRLSDVARGRQARLEGAIQLEIDGLIDSLGSKAAALHIRVKLLELQLAQASAPQRRQG